MDKVEIEPLHVMSGVLYSGLEANWQGQRIVFDLSTAKISGKTILRHDHKTVIGSAVPKIKDNQLIVEDARIFDSSEDARTVAANCKAEVPYKMSAGWSVYRSNISKVETGEMSVNGRTFKAPFLLATDAVLSEATICPVGRDMNTSINAATIYLSADVLSDLITVEEIPSEGKSMELEEIKAELAKAKTELVERDARLETLEKTISDMQMSAVLTERKHMLKGLLPDDKLADAEFSVELSSMPAKSFEFFVGSLGKPKADDLATKVIEKLNVDLSAKTNDKPLSAKEEVGLAFKQMGDI